MLDTNSIFSNLVLLAIAHNRFNRPLEAGEIQNKLVVEHVFLASVCSCSHVDRQEKRIVQEYCQLNYDTDSCGCADESRDEAPKDRSREKKKKRTIGRYKAG